MENLVQADSLHNSLWLTVLLASILVALLLLVIFIRILMKRLNSLKSNLNEFDVTIKQVCQKLENNEAQSRTLIKDIGVMKSQMREEFSLIKLSLSNHIDSLLKNVENSRPQSPEVFLPRLEAYKQLWEITDIVGNGRPEPISASDRQNLKEELSSWYFEGGNGIFLSSESLEKLQICLEEMESSRAETLKQNLSQLRVQLKNDLNVYDKLDAEIEILSS